MGAELHIRKYEEAPPYHCHIIFDEVISAESIDKINSVLDELYPVKTVVDTMKDIPNIEKINKYIKSEKRISSFENLEPETLFKSGFSERPKVNGYEDLAKKIYADISSNDRRSYKIKTSEGKDFETLSPGWKSAIILDLILGYKGDAAPLIIDQPEDNLAIDYINHRLVEQIKKIKPQKQIILVSHNATIPMLGDAQNIILCKNDNGRILIRSAALEASVDGKRILDYVAEITDGGKQSIRKRVKKYDLKKYREEH